MEPFAIQANPGLIHPAANHLQGDLSAVLREGRVLAGEVLESFGGGSLLIGIGRHRVPADAQVRMQPGQRFLFQVEGSGDQVVLRILAEGAAGDDALLRALRGVVGQDRPVGELLSALAASLRALPGGGEALEGLVGQLARFLFQPGSSGAALQQLLISAGLSYEARLAAVAARTLPAPQARGLASELRAWLLAGLTGADDAAPQPAALADSLRAQLTSLLAGGLPDVDVELAFSRWLAGDPLGSGPGRAPTDLASLLQRALAELPGSHEALQAALARLDVSALGRPLGGLLLRSLLGLAPEGLALGSAAVQGELAGLAAGFGDLKARLLRALAAARGSSLDSSATETLDRSLAGLEAEQLMNVARGRSREPLHWSFPVPEGLEASGDPTAGRWATAHLFFRRLSDGGHQHDAQGGEVDVQRLTLAVDFTSTGPLRADLVARPGSLALRLLATREDVVERLRGGLAELESRLALGGRRVLLSLAQAPAEKVRVDEAGQDIRFLREHHLMDRKG